MATIGHILGIVFLIFGVMLLVGIIRHAINFDFDAPDMTGRITFRDDDDAPKESD